MRICLICLSPRKNGTSSMLVDYFYNKLKEQKHTVRKEYLYQNLHELFPIIKMIKWSDCIVMIGPSYVDSYPADVLRLLESMARAEDVLHGQSLYGMIQGGMPYVHTHESGIGLLGTYASKEHVTFKGGFVMGGGAVLDGKPLEQVIGAKKMVPAVNRFIKHISKNEVALKEEYQAVQMKLPLPITWLLSKAMNTNIRKSLKKHNINYKKQSPYELEINHNTVKIRQEKKEDYYQTELMTKRAFWNLHVPGCNEHYLVHLLRESEEYIRDISRVACINGKVAGAIFYAKAYVFDGEKKQEVLTFGPLCVDPMYQKQGIGRRLLEETMRLAREKGYQAIIIFGEPSYYPKHGFVNCKEFGITTEDGTNIDAFMGIELVKGALDNIKGKFYEPAPYQQCDCEKVEEYDKKFPYIPKLKLPS